MKVLTTPVRKEAVKLEAKLGILSSEARDPIGETSANKSLHVHNAAFLMRNPESFCCFSDKNADIRLACFCLAPPSEPQ